MNTWKTRGLSLILTGTVLVSTMGVGVLAADKNAPTEKKETVFAVAGANGTTKEVIVSGQLTNGNGADVLEDISDLTDLQVVKGDAEKTESSGSIRWETGGGDVYYQGTTEKALPVSVEFTYELDGKKLTPEELEGKSGKLKITVSYKNGEQQSVDVDGEKETMYAPYLMATGMIFPEGCCRNVKVDHGVVETDGDRTVVLCYGLPGLADSLKLEEVRDNMKNTAKDGKQSDKADGEDETLEIPESVEITADVTDFELETAITVASAGLLDDLDFSDNDTRAELEDVLDELDDATEQLLDGTGELLDGVKELKDGSSQLKDGAGTLQDGAGQLLSGGEALQSGAGTLQSGAASLDDGAKTLNAGIYQVQQALMALDAQSGTLTGGSAQVKQALSQIQKELDGISAYAGKIETLVQGSSQMKAAIDTVVSSVSALEQGVSYAAYVAAVKQQTGGVVDVDQIEQKNTEAVAMLNQMIAALEQQLAGLKAGQSTDSGNSREAAKAPADKTAESPVSEETPADSQEDTTEPTDATEVPESAEEITGGQSADVVSPADGEEAAVEGLSANGKGYHLQLLANDAQAAQIAALEQQIGTLKNMVGLLSLNNASILGTRQYLTAVNRNLQLLLEGEDGNGGLKSLQANYAVLDQGIGQLAVTLNGLMGKMANLTTLVTAYTTLDDGLGAYTGAVSQILAGQKQIAAGAGSLAQGTGQLRTGAGTLREGTDTLVSGASELYDGTGELYDGTVELDDGVQQLLDGAQELKDGMQEFREDGIEKILNLYRDNIPLLISRLTALQQLGREQSSFSGLPEGTEGTVRYVIRTE